MTEQGIRENRLRLRGRLCSYLNASKVGVKEPYTVCPNCGEAAFLREDRWSCSHCGKGGDLLDYVLVQNPHMDEGQAIRHICRLLGLKITTLEAIPAKELMDMEFSTGGFLVERLLGRGLYLLVGASKIGKSWMVLGMADSISKGEPLWGLRTRQTEVLYVSLEDTLSRIQQRLNLVTDGEPGQVWLATEAELLGQGFEEQLTGFLKQHPAVGLVIIDTLQRIREIRSDRYSYAGDYETMTILKDIADRHGLSILVVHHTRKEQSEDPFSMISGTTGLLGCADGALILQRRSRLSEEASLDVTGREMEDLQLRLLFDREKKRWRFVEFGSDSYERQRDSLLLAVQALVRREGSWQGTATELAEALGPELPQGANPSALSRRLNAFRSALRDDYGVDCSFRREPGGGRRTICLKAVS